MSRGRSNTGDKNNGRPDVSAAGDQRLSQSIWLRAVRPSRRERPALSHDAIVRAALAVADAEGLDAVSMRRIAADLGVGTMTLYVYVRSKGELLQLMYDAIAADLIVPEPLPAGWRDALRAIAHQTRQMLLRHPWAVQRVDRPRFSPNLLRHIEQTLQALDSLALDGYTAALMLTALDDYIAGFVLREQAGGYHLPTDDPPPAALVPATDLYLEHMLASGRFPRMARQLALTTGSSGRDPFADGLEMLLDGMASLLSKQPRSGDAGQP